MHSEKTLNSDREKCIVRKTLNSEQSLEFCVRRIYLDLAEICIFSRGQQDDAKYVYLRAGPVPCMYFPREVPEALIWLHFIWVLETEYGPTEGRWKYYFVVGPAGPAAK